MSDENLTLVAAASYMLDHKIGVFSKKQNRETGFWWIMLFHKRAPDAPIKFDGDTLEEAIVAGLKHFGIGGIKWSLAKLDSRVRTLTNWTDAEWSRVFQASDFAKLLGIARQHNIFGTPLSELIEPKDDL